MLSDAYGVSFGIGLGEMNGKAFRIGHLGSLTDVMVLSGLATIEMAMADLDYPVKLGQRRCSGAGILPKHPRHRCQSRSIRNDTMLDYTNSRRPDDRAHARGA